MQDFETVLSLSCGTHHKVSPSALAPSGSASSLALISGAQKAYNLTGKPAQERDNRYLPPGPRVPWWGGPTKPPGLVQTSLWVSICPPIHPSHRSQLERGHSLHLQEPFRQDLMPLDSDPPSYTQILGCR